jgi:hypothetical protein
VGGVEGQREDLGEGDGGPAVGHVHADAGHGRALEVAETVAGALDPDGEPACRQLEALVLVAELRLRELAVGSELGHGDRLARQPAVEQDEQVDELGPHRGLDVVGVALHGDREDPAHR